MFGFEDDLQDEISILKDKNKKLNFLLSDVIERLELLKSYDMFCGYGGDLEVDECDLNKGEYIKRDDLIEVIEKMKRNVL